MDASGVIRKLLPSERAEVRAHLLRLDPEDRWLRFAGPASDARIEAYCDGLDESITTMIGYVVDGEVRGLGELKPLGAAWPRVGEAAVSVERAFQNRGVGTALLCRLIVIARNRSIRSLSMICLLENGRMLRIARKAGARVEFDHGEVGASLALPWPTHLTFLLEHLDDLRAVVAAGPPGGRPEDAARSGRAA